MDLRSLRTSPLSEQYCPMEIYKAHILLNVLIATFLKKKIFTGKISLGFCSGSVVKNPPASAGNEGSILGSGRSLRRRKWQRLQYSCLEKSHGQRSLAGCSLCYHKESDTTQSLNNNNNKINIFNPVYSEYQWVINIQNH